jgi:zona occludens toxin (predicted ATPase)
LAVGFKQRERKRCEKAAMATDQARSRASGSSSSAWWLTIVLTTTCCANCAGILRARREMVYRHAPREALCVACADRRGLKYRPSVKWEREYNAHKPGHE